MGGCACRGWVGALVGVWVHLSRVGALVGAGVCTCRRDTGVIWVVNDARPPPPPPPPPPPLGAVIGAGSELGALPPPSAIETLGLPVIEGGDVSPSVPPLPSWGKYRVRGLSSYDWNGDGLHPRRGVTSSPSQAGKEDPRWRVCRYGGTPTRQRRGREEESRPRRAHH